TELFTGKKEKAKTKELLHTLKVGGKRMVAFGSGASFSLKRWPKENFLELGQLLFDLGFYPVLMGGPGEEEAEWIAKESEGKVINIAGQLNFLETADFLSNVALAISNDSAIVHFAEAMGTPAIALFGPTVKEFGFGPFLEKSLLLDRELKCRPCSRNGKGTCNIKEELKCLRDISTEEVLLEALRIIGETSESQLLTPETGE
ncbi:MAG: glycosyltransferase family 9 protein, partial [SAR324 cluster bacterium]|nr:glycosyltransferase family 9 protein [SAR324 cluster bacterium]